MEKKSIHAKKSLGQNFLISQRIVESIVKAGDLVSTDTVIEIGPGKGVLTESLLKTGARVKAIEKDNRLIPILSEKFKTQIENRTFELFHRDVLEILPNEFLDIAGGPYKVIANIPYYITGALLRNFLSLSLKPTLMVLMVQKEVAKRILARDGKESILSISVKVYATPEIVVNVSKGNFFPIPTVDSAVLKLSHLHNPFENKDSENRFFEFVKAGFAQKRKKLISNLEAIETKEILEKKFELLGITKNARAEELPLDTWLKLSKN
jgi:16S rRNA (adenine1518-N6/adenine1519-N6)-dimethyltransferase